MAAIMGDRAMHRHIGCLPSWETVHPAPRGPKPQISPVLRTECGISPNTTITAVKRYDGEVGTSRNCRDEGEHKEAESKSQTHGCQLHTLTHPRPYCAQKC